MSKVNLEEADTCMQGLALLERDESGDLMHVWSFPGVDETTKSTLLARSQLSDVLISKRAPYAFSRTGSVWHYSLCSFTVAVEKNNKHVTSFNLVLSSTKFAPEKYRALLTIMSDVYSEKANVVEVLGLYLSSYTSGSCFIPRPPDQPKGEWDARNFNDKKALITNCSLREVCSMFQAETIILWQAMVLKKNILIHSNSIQKMQRFVRTMPHFVFQRGESAWRALYPLIIGMPAEMDELSSTGYYVVGTTTESLRADHAKMFDLFVDLDDRIISVSEHAKKDFGMGKMHKQIAGMLMEQINAGSDSAVIKTIVGINNSLMKKLKGIDGGLTNDSLQKFSEAQSYSKSEARFVMNFSMSEGLL